MTYISRTYMSLASLRDVTTTQHIFNGACINGYLKIAKISYCVYGVKIDHDIFRCCLYNDMYDICYWLYKKDNTVINIITDDFFADLCEYNSRKLIDWILKIKPTINTSYDDEKAFRSACANGNLIIAKRLYDLRPTINLMVKDNSAYNDALKYGHMSVVRWLEYYVKTYIGVKDILECPICFYTSNVIALCEHQFCYKCISFWLRNHNNCPCCRKEIKLYECNYIFKKN